MLGVDGEIVSVPEIGKRSGDRVAFGSDGAVKSDTVLILRRRGHCIVAGDISPIACIHWMMSVDFPSLACVLLLILRP